MFYLLVMLSFKIINIFLIIYTFIFHDISPNVLKFLCFVTKHSAYVQYDIII